LAACVMLYVAVWSYFNRGTFNPVKEDDLASVGNRLPDLLRARLLIVCVTGSSYARRRPRPWACSTRSCGPRNSAR